MPMLCPPDTPDASSAEPLWTDVAGVWISGIGALASTLVAVAALVVSLVVMRAQRGDAERDARASWASDMQVWLDDGQVHMLVDDAYLVDENWVSAGRVLMARASTLSSPGTESLMLAARDAREIMRTLTDDERKRAVLPTTLLLKHWVRDWVNNTHETNPPIADWVRGFAKASADSE